MSKLSTPSNEASNSNRSTSKFCTGTGKLMYVVGWGWGCDLLLRFGVGLGCVMCKLMAYANLLLLLLL